MQPFTAIAVDAALDDPRTWTTVPGSGRVTTVDPYEVTIGPAEEWRPVPGYPVDVSSRGRVRSSRSGVILVGVERARRHHGWVIRIDGRSTWVPVRVVEKALRWE